ncbi:hypothetical protein RhiirA4_408029, partial [Rhizophagus irregularis]
ISHFIKISVLKIYKRLSPPLKNTQFPDDWKLTKQALTKIMGPLENWLFLQQAPKHEELVSKTYDEQLDRK